MTAIAKLARLGLFDARVPRYTSYPTAAQFTDATGAAEEADWIGAIPEGSEISLYVHIPFCRRLCWFCACRTQGTATLTPVAAYLHVLHQEIALVADRLPAGVKLSQLHWGGGTPTLLAPELITELANEIFKVMPLAEGGEFSVEIDPNEIDDARLDALAAAGMNRASIGVQDFDPDIQAIIGREQSFEVTAAAAYALRARGIESLNCDILFGLPTQTPAKVTESVQKLLSISPDRVALYGYAHVPWMARRQTMIPSDLLPRPEERLKLFETARRIFLWDGYEEVGIDHFARAGDSMGKAARTGTLRRNFQGYTVDRAEVLIGLGASAISRYPQGFVQNASGTRDYAKAIDAGQLAGARGHAFRGDDILRSRMIEELMCHFAIDAQALADETGRPKAEILKLMEPLSAEFGEFVEFNDWGLRVPVPGRALTRMMARRFDAYAQDSTRHSHAI